MKEDNYLLTIMTSRYLGHEVKGLCHNELSQKELVRMKIILVPYFINYIGYFSKILFTYLCPWLQVTE